MRIEADPPLFRTRSFEANWDSVFAFLPKLSGHLVVLPSGAGSAVRENAPALEMVLAFEADLWLRLGVSIGYFAAVDRTFESRWRAAPGVSTYFDTQPIGLTPDQFGAQLDLAWSRLSVEEIVFLLLLHFARDDQWSQSIQHLDAAATGMEQTPGWRPEHQWIEGFSWAFIEDDSPLMEGGNPAAWRLGRYENYGFGPNPQRVRSRYAELAQVQVRIVRAVLLADAETGRDLGSSVPQGAPLLDGMRDLGEHG